jgi:nucleoside-diphosphate-sugar epimerase
MSAVDPNSSYAIGKLRAEAILRDRPALNSPQSVSLRIFNVFGEDSSDSLVSKLLRSTVDHPVSLRGLDSFVRDYIHLDDVAAAIVASLTSALPVRDSIFNIGSGVATTNRELIETLSEHATIHYRLADGRPSFSCADVRLARDFLGFACTHKL